MLVALLAIDLVTGPDVFVIALYGVAPLVASFGCGWRTTAVVAVAALAVRGDVAHDVRRDGHAPTAPSSSSPSGCIGVLACGAAVARTRREASAARAGLLAEVGRAALDGAGPGRQAPRRGRRRGARRRGPLHDRPDRCPAATPSAPSRSRARRRRRSSRRSRASRAAPRRRSRGSELVMPLVARDVRLGALELGVNGSLRRFGAEDRALAEELARRCAAALDNARLVAEAQAAESELHEAYGLLDAIFERAPVGLAVHDLDLRYVRINDRMAEINGVPAADAHRAHRRRDPARGGGRRGRACAACSRAASRSPSSRSRARPPRRPASTASGIVSYWPVRRRDDHRVVGVGAVVFEVTERRAAERAAHEQTARYESLLLALSQVGEAMVVADGDGAARVREPRLRGDLRLQHRGAQGAAVRLPTSSSRSSARTPAAARRCGSRAAASPGNQLTIRHRDGHRIPMEVAGVPLDVGEAPPDGRGRPRRHGARPRRGRARAAAAPRRLPGRGERRLRRGARRGRDARTRSPASPSASSPTPA